MKEKAMEKVNALSNEELGESLVRVGQKIAVNALTRGFIIAGISSKLDEFTDEEITTFFKEKFEIDLSAE